MLIYRGSGVVNFAQGAFAMIGAFLYYRATGDRNWSPALAWLVALGVPALLGVLTHVLVMSRLRYASSLVRVVATLAVFFLALAVANQVWGEQGTPVRSPLPITPARVPRRRQRHPGGPALAHRHRGDRHRGAVGAVPMDPLRSRHRRRRREPDRSSGARVLARSDRDRQLGIGWSACRRRPACSSRRSSSSASPRSPSPCCVGWPPRSSDRSGRSGGRWPGRSASVSSSRPSAATSRTRASSARSSPTTGSCSASSRPPRCTARSRSSSSSSSWWSAADRCRCAAHCSTGSPRSATDGST